MFLYQILVCTIHGKILKSQTKTINLKYHLQHEMENLIYLMDCTLYQIFKITFNTFFKNMGKTLITLQ